MRREQKWTGAAAVTMLRENDGEGAVTALEDFKTVAFARGTVLFEQGDPPGEAYLIHSGIVVITAKRGGHEVVVDTLRRGDFVGELALVDNEPRSATAIAGEDCVCAVITKAEVDKSLASADLLTYALVRLLTKRLRKSTERAGAMWSSSAACTYIGVVIRRRSIFVPFTSRASGTTRLFSRYMFRR